MKLLFITNNKKSPLLWPIIIFMALKPIYVFESGGLQPCDFFLALYIAYHSIRTKGSIPWKNINPLFVFIILCVICWQCMINVFWYVAYSDAYFLISSVFYIYNLGAFLFFAKLGLRTSLTNFKSSIAAGTILSASVTLLGVVLNYGNYSSIRTAGFFNNPNQLGFYGVILFTLLFFVKDVLSKPWRIFLLYTSACIVMASSSKAAFGGLCILAVCYILFDKNKQSVFNNFGKIFLLACFVFLIYSFLSSLTSTTTDNSMLSNMQYRILHMADKADSDLATGRGYARIFEMGANFFWGMGEGAFYRFHTLKGLEVHSLFVNLLVSYGVIGALGYICIVGYVLINGVKRTFYNMAGFSGIFIYSFTHNSIRNSAVWLILALLCVEKVKSKLVDRDSETLSKTENDKSQDTNYSKEIL